MCKNRLLKFLSYPLILILPIVIFTTCSPISEDRKTLGLEITPEPTLDSIFRDDTWFTIETCLPPCWQGLEIGQSSKEESIKVVSALPFVESGRLLEDSLHLWDRREGISVDADAVKFYYAQPRNMISSILFFVDDSLVGVSFSPNYPLTFKTVVEHIGNPDYLYYRPVTPEMIDCEVNLIWVSKDLTLTYYEQFETGGRNLCQEIRDGQNIIPSQLQVNDVYIMQNKYWDIPEEDFKYRWNGFMKE